MTTPWPALERNSALRAIPSVWREFMGGQFETFQAAVFQKLPEPAQGFFCERCYCTHEVIIYGPEAHARALADIGHRPSPNAELPSTHSPTFPLTHSQP